jgi:hypothetical protein
MVPSATLVLLAFWLAAVWYCDVDGYNRRRKAPADARFRKEVGCQERTGSCR